MQVIHNTVTVIVTKSCSHNESVKIEGVKIEEGGLSLFYFSFHFYFLFDLFFYFSIFRTTRVRVDQSYRHISHLIAKSQDRSQDLGELSRRFENR